MATPGRIAALTLALCAALCLLSVPCQSKACDSGNVRKLNGRSGIKLYSYYNCSIAHNCSITHKVLNASQLEWWLKGWVSTVILPTIYTTVLLVGLPANGLAIWVFAVKIKKSPSTLYLLNLATTDLFFLLVLPFKASYYFLGNNWLFGEALCRMVTAFFYMNMYCSSLFLTCISVDRYFSLVHPFKARGAQGWRKSLFISLSIWVLVTAAMIPFLLVQQTIRFFDPDSTTCHDITAVSREKDWLLHYMVGLVILGFAVPFVVVVFCYGSILLTFASKRRENRRVISLVLLVLFNFLLCFTPSSFLYFYQSLDHPIERQNQLYTWYTLSLAVGALNSCIDPFIYYFTSSDFQKQVKAAVSCQKGKNREHSGRTSDQLLQKKNTMSTE